MSLRDKYDIFLIFISIYVRICFPLGEEDWSLSWKLYFYWVTAFDICLCQLLVLKLNKSGHLKIQVKDKVNVDTTYIHIVNYALRLHESYTESHY